MRTYPKAFVSLLCDVSLPATIYYAVAPDDPEYTPLLCYTDLINVLNIGQCSNDIKREFAYLNAKYGVFIENDCYCYLSKHLFVPSFIVEMVLRGTEHLNIVNKFYGFNVLNTLIKSLYNEVEKNKKIIDLDNGHIRINY